jgi:MOSC domain-containing protein YiiM
MFEGEVVHLFVAADKGVPLVSKKRVRAVAGLGLEGDRYFDERGTFSKKKGPDRQITFIEIEAIDALARDYGIRLAPKDARRNVVTRGVPLNHLVGEEFTVGRVRCRGLRLCEPCGYLEGRTTEGVREGLLHRGGLRAEILEGGEIAVGDTIVDARRARRRRA